MSKHTPGPWQLAEKFNCVDVRAVNGPYVSNCNQSIAIDWSTKEANARLIAAAPELLEALEDLMSYLRAIDETVDITYQYKAAKAAINKATGE